MYFTKSQLFCWWQQSIEEKDEEEEEEVEDEEKEEEEGYWVLTQFLPEPRLLWNTNITHHLLRYVATALQDILPLYYNDCIISLLLKLFALLQKSLWSRKM